MFSEEGEYPVSAICLEDTLTCGFTRSQFEELVLKNPTVGLQVIKTLSEKISWLTTRVGNLAVTNIEDRPLQGPLQRCQRAWGAKSPGGGDHSISIDSRGSEFFDRHTPGDGYPGHESAEGNRKKLFLKTDDLSCHLWQLHNQGDFNHALFFFRQQPLKTQLGSFRRPILP